MPELSQTGAFPFVCEGGLVLNQSTFIMKPGQALELLNFEPDIEGGYRRITGFSKYVTAVVPQTSASSEEVLMVATLDQVLLQREVKRYLVLPPVVQVGQSEILVEVVQASTHSKDLTLMATTS